MANGNSFDERQLSSDHDISRNDRNGGALLTGTFRRNPIPAGTLLNWVCRDNPDFLDLTGDAMALSPAR